MSTPVATGHEFATHISHVADDEIVSWRGQRARELFWRTERSSGGHRSGLVVNSLLYPSAGDSDLIEEEGDRDGY